MNLQESQTVELKTNVYQASTRNKQIAEAFYLTGDIENYGSGFIRMRDAVKAYPTMQFNFRSTGQGFVTEFSYEEQKIEKKVTENVTKNVTGNRLTQIIELIKENPQVTTLEIANQLSLTKRTILRDIEKLKQGNFIQYVGPAKGGYWKILKQNND